MKKITTTLAILLFIVMAFSVSVDAWNPTLDNAHYMVRASVNEIRALQFKLGFGFDRFNSFDTLFAYNGDSFDLQGTWLLNFTGDQEIDMNLRLNAATKLAERSIRPAIGVGGEFPLGDRNYTFWSIDYYFNVSSNNLVYEAGVGFPITANSDLTLGVGNSFWDRGNNEAAIGLKVGF